MIYDNKGATMDRYTVVYMDMPEERGLYFSLGMNAFPFDPQGIGRHGSARPGEHLGKIIEWEQLPEQCQLAVLEDFLTT